MISRTILALADTLACAIDECDPDETDHFVKYELPPYIDELRAIAARPGQSHGPHGPVRNLYDWLGTQIYLLRQRASSPLASNASCLTASYTLEAHQATRAEMRTLFPGLPIEPDTDES